VNPADYDAWYKTPRGSWIGQTEYRLLQRMLEPRRGESMLDVGCGTGHFTRRFAGDGLALTGVDLNAAWLAHAAQHASAGEQYVCGDAICLPFPDKSFDLSISVAALCFVPDHRHAIEEMLRVTRRRFAIGLLNRHSLLYLQKGCGGGSGAYRGAHWHTAAEIRKLFVGLPVRNARIQTAVFLPGAGWLTQRLEEMLPANWPGGSFVAVSGELANGRQVVERRSGVSVLPGNPVKQLLF